MSETQTMPPQRQHQPGIERIMHPRPEFERADELSARRLKGKRAVITGGDSGIGRAVAISFAKEGADVAILYLQEHEDAEETRRRVEELGRRCLCFSGDVGDEQFCRKVISEIAEAFGGIDVLVNNAAEQHRSGSLEEISAEQLERTFRTNIFGYFFLTKAALPHMERGGSIINTTSVTAYRGSPQLLDYATTKGAIVAFTRSLAASLVERGIRVNGVAPGPIWTPLIPATFDEEKVSQFGSQVPMHRPGQPAEVAPSFVFLASEDASYMTGQVLHPNGGEPVAS